MENSEFRPRFNAARIGVEGEETRSLSQFAFSAPRSIRCLPSVALQAINTQSYTVKC
jgi:hypothetical protein